MNRWHLKLVGPDGAIRERSLLLPPDPWPPFLCHRQDDSEWEHYERAEDGVYEFAGVCADIDHEGADPHDHEDEE